MKAHATRRAIINRRHELIAEHAAMARRIAMRVAKRVPDWMNREDLVSTAMVGLVEAAERFDATRGEPFVAFAERRIRGAVLDELRRGDILPRRKRILARQIGKTIRELEKKLVRPPEDEEIAEALSIGVDEYLNEVAMLANVGFLELGAEEKIEKLPLSADQSPDVEASKRQLAGIVKRGLDNMQERDVLVLSLYYIEELTLSEVGQVLAVSESRVSQLQSRALARLRAELDRLPS